MDLRINLYKEYYNSNNSLVYNSIIILYLLTSLYTSHYILTRSLYLSSLDTQLSYSRIDQLLSLSYRLQ